MQIAKLIAELSGIKEHYGDVEVYLQDTGQHEVTMDTGEKKTVDGLAFASFFVVPEQYAEEDGGWTVNIRCWPY